MLLYASSGPEGLECEIDDEYWAELKRQLAVSERRYKSWREARIRSEQQLVAERQRRAQTIHMLRDALMVAVADDQEIARLNGEKTSLGKAQNTENILEAARVLEVAGEVRGDTPAYTTEKDKDYIRSDADHIKKQLGAPVVALYDKSGMLQFDRDDGGKYNPAIMLENEDDAKYFRRLRLQSRPDPDSQLVLDVTGWVVARPDKGHFAKHPVTGELVELPREQWYTDPITEKLVKIPVRKHLIWPSAIRFQDIYDLDAERMVIDTRERDYPMGSDLLPAREARSGIAICGEAEGYKMPAPITGPEGGKIYSEPNAKLRKARQKRNFDLQQEIVKGLYRMYDNANMEQTRVEEVAEQLQAMAPLMQSYGIEVPAVIANFRKSETPPYTISQEELDANRRNMLVDLEGRRVQRVVSFIMRPSR